MQDAIKANRYTYFALFLVTLSTLMYEILLTRIFSVITYYHFAFMVISIVMFGMTLGAILVYQMPLFRDNKSTHTQLAFSALFFSVTVMLSFLVLLYLPLTFELTIPSLLYTAKVYSLITIPFVFSGICVCLVLTKFSQQTNTLYATDLAGAAIGCGVVILVLNQFSGPTSVIFVAIFAGLAAIAFSKNTLRYSLRFFSLSCTLLLGLLALVSMNSDLHNASLFRLTWVKNHFEAPAIYEKWNSFSRVTIHGDPVAWQKPFGWGMSEMLPKDEKARYLMLTIDASAATPLLNFNGNLNSLNYLKYDVTNVAHYLIHDGNVLVVGVGGGRDILSALVFNQRSILGIELNPNIIDVVTKKYANYVGNIHQNPRVTIINDEARNYITRSSRNFDVIQISLIDTWAATAAGAFALSENALYTTQAFQTFLSHLSSGGILSVSRWYSPELPGEIYRLATLASAALREIGVAHPAENIMILTSSNGKQNQSVATMLISRNAFTAQEISSAEKIAKQMHFSILLAPGKQTDSIFNYLISEKNLNPIIDRLGLNINPPTDDKPFFFEMFRLKNLFQWHRKVQDSASVITHDSVKIISSLAIVISILTFLCIFIPLITASKKIKSKSSKALLIYFASIGLGFMFVEISQMQKLSLFLGHPTYGLSVVLFTLLISCGFGSLLASNKLKHYSASGLPLLLLMGILVLYGCFTPYLLQHFLAETIFYRIVIAILMLFPLGFSMGILLPMGMILANQHSPERVPWLWGVNGATSICASVLAIVVSLVVGISFSFWVGVMAYGVAVLAYYALNKS